MSHWQNRCAPQIHTRRIKCKYKEIIRSVLTYLAACGEQSVNNKIEVAVQLYIHR